MMTWRATLGRTGKLCIVSGRGKTDASHVTTTTREGAGFTLRLIGASLDGLGRWPPTLAFLTLFAVV
jgi:hypothetical protein